MTKSDNNRAPSLHKKSATKLLSKTHTHTSPVTHDQKDHLAKILNQK